MITISMFIKCVVLIVLIVYASECSGVMYVERGTRRLGKILNRNTLLRSHFTMTNFYVPLKDQGLSPETHNPNYSGVLKNKSAEKNNKIATNNNGNGASLQYYPVTTAEKNYTRAQNNLTTEHYNNSTQTYNNVTTEVVITKAPIKANKSEETVTPKTNIDSSKYLQQALMTLIIKRTEGVEKDELDNSSKEPENTQPSATKDAIESILGFTNIDMTNNDKVLKTNSTTLKNVTEFDNSTIEPKETESSVTSNKIERITDKKNYDEDAKTNLTSLKNVTEFDNSTIEPKKIQSLVTRNEIKSITGMKNEDENTKPNSTSLKNVTEFDNSTIESKETQSIVIRNYNESITEKKHYDEDAKTNLTNLKNVTEFDNFTIEPKKIQSSVTEIESITEKKTYDEDVKTNLTNPKNITKFDNFTIEHKKIQSSVTRNEIESITEKKTYDEDVKTNLTNLKNVTEFDNSTIKPKETHSSVMSITEKKKYDEGAKTNLTNLKNATKFINSIKEPKKHIEVSVNNLYDKITRMRNVLLPTFGKKKMYAEVTSETAISTKGKEKNSTHNYKKHSLMSTRKMLGSNTTREPKGFFGHGLFALPKVLNFFPVGGERECRPEEPGGGGGGGARAGICLNPYDCRQRGGAAGGDCAHGLGVCCVFEVTCGGVAANNLTYFMSPGFPELWGGFPERECSITIEKAFAGIMQLKIDFVHFTIGQPNRLTGECDEDALILGEGKNNFTLCGQNHGQHIYYTLPTASEKREAGELPTIKSTRLHIRMKGGDMPRLWLLRIAQLPLINSAPNNCLQYFTSNNGTIKTFNFASNGRHLASQEYRACIRRNNGYCAIRYSPCDARSFRIGGSDTQEPTYDDTLIEDQMMEANGSMQDEVEGSGMDPDSENGSIVTRRPPPAKKQPNFWETMWSYMLPSWIWKQGRDRRKSRSFPVRWSPYLQHYKSSPENDDFRYYGYGTFGLGLHGFGRQACGDRITIPCESEYFVSSSSYGPGVCDPHHCGSSFCSGHHQDQCHVETSITPFAVSVHFGPPVEKRSPEENIGACLRFQQVPCDG